MTMDNANAWVVIIVAVTGGLTTLATTLIGIITYMTNRQTRATAEKLEEVHTVVNSNLTKKEAEIELLRNMLVGSEMQAKVAESARALLAEQAAKVLQGPLPVVVVPTVDPLPVTVVPPDSPPRPGGAS